MPDNPASAALEEIRAREQAATRGPWWFDEDDLMWRLHGVHAVLPTGIDWLPDQVLNHQILKAPKSGTPYAEYWPNDADAAFIIAARTDVPRLLKALEAALGFHQPVQLHGMAFSPSRGTPRCGHGPDYDGDAHYEGDDGLWYCESLPGPVACSGCPGSPDGEYADWPCPEYEEILAALTGKETSGG
jgi:hypothetical protein